MNTESNVDDTVTQLLATTQEALDDLKALEPVFSGC